MVEVLRDWLSPGRYRSPHPDQPTGLWMVASSLAADLRLEGLVPDLETLAKVVEQETPGPQGTHSANTLRQTIDRLTAGP